MSLEYVLSMSGFYLGYSRGRSFPPPKKNIVIVTVYSNYIGKIIQTRRGQCTRSKFKYWTLYEKENIEYCNIVRT